MGLENYSNSLNFYLLIIIRFWRICMQHWRRPATDGAEFWISCKQLAFLSSFNRLQVIQNKRHWCLAAAYVTAG